MPHLSVFPFEDAGSARPFQLPYRLERSPAIGGAEALTAQGGGEGDQLSICQEEF